MAALHIKFEMPKDLVNQAYEIIEMARDTGRIRRGANEVTKLVERGQAKLVVMSEDTTPAEILAHLPMLCEEKDIPYAYVPSKQELGNAAGLKVSTAAVVVTTPGKSRVLLENLVKQLQPLYKKE